LLIGTMRQDVDALTHNVTVLQTQIDDFKELQRLHNYRGSASMLTTNLVSE
jgi:hypothetical protein